MHGNFSDSNLAEGKKYSGSSPIKGAPYARLSLLEWRTMATSLALLTAIKLVWDGFC